MPYKENVLQKLLRKSYKNQTQKTKFLEENTAKIVLFEKNNFLIFARFSLKKKNNIQNTSCLKQTQKLYFLVLFFFCWEEWEIIKDYIITNKIIQHLIIMGENHDEDILLNSLHQNKTLQILNILKCTKHSCITYKFQNLGTFTGKIDWDVFQISDENLHCEVI